MENRIKNVIETLLGIIVFLGLIALGLLVYHLQNNH